MTAQLALPLSSPRPAALPVPARGLLRWTWTRAWSRAYPCLLRLRRYSPGVTIRDRRTGDPVEDVPGSWYVDDLTPIDLLRGAGRQWVSAVDDGTWGRSP